MSVSESAAVHPIPCTVGILTRNSAGGLGRALASVRAFAEVVVADGHSTDRTVELAESFGARVIQQPSNVLDAEGRLTDFAQAMNQLVDAASQPWFYKLDSDEFLTDELVAEIAREVSAAVEVDAFAVPFRYVVAGVEIEHASTYPAAEPRLFRVAAGVRYEQSIHERLVFEPERVRLLAGFHLKPQPSAWSTARKWSYYLRLEMAAARGVGTDAWRREYLKRHRWLAIHLTKRTFSAIRARRPARMPLRYELLRIGNHLLAIPLTRIAARRRRSVQP